MLYNGLSAYRQVVMVRDSFGSAKGLSLLDLNRGPRWKCLNYVLEDVVGLIKLREESRKVEKRSEEKRKRRGEGGAIMIVELGLAL
jgi:hypothetical protein